jgi:HAD superfamily hydrolase (TIGR01509 family)
MTLDALIFDVDGTLAETEEIHRLAFNDTFAAFELDWHWDADTYNELLKVTGGKERMRHYLTHYRPRDGAAAQSYIDAMHKEKNRRYALTLKRAEIDLRPGVKRLIYEAIERRVKLAIATTTAMPNVSALLTGTLGRDALDLFFFVAAGDSVARKKPSPDIYALVLNNLNLRPDRCIAIEDSFNGVQAARQAGIAALATISTNTVNDDLRYAFAVLSDLGEPDKPYLHLSGAGADDTHVTINALSRWAFSTTG